MADHDKLEVSALVSTDDIVEWDAISAQSQYELNAHKKSHVHLSNACVEDNKHVHTCVYKCSIYK